MTAAIFCAVFLLFLVGSTNITRAAVTATVTPMNSNSANTIKANATQPVLRINMSESAGETLTSVTVHISSATTATPTAFSLSSLAPVVDLVRDADGNGLFDATDTVIATATPNLALTQLSVSATTTASGTFFVAINTASSTAWTDNGYPETATAGAVPQEFTVGVPTSSIITSTSSPTISTTTTAPFMADIHSQIPNAGKIADRFQSPDFYVMDNGSGGVDEAGIIYVYASSSSSTPIASGNVSPDGRMDINIGSTQRPFVWLEEVDAAGNATSTGVNHNITSSAAASVTSINAYTDRIIINLSGGLNNSQATNCNNYSINGAQFSCSGIGTYIDFFGNQVILHGLSLTQGSTATISISGITDMNGNPFSYTNNNMTVKAPDYPVVTSLSSGSGIAGASVTINGSNFGSATGTILFSGGMGQSGPTPPVQASTTLWTSTAVTAIVPAGAQSGPLQVISSSGAMSDQNSNTFFDVLSNYYVKLAVSTSTSPVTTSTGMVFAIFGPDGMSIRHVGDNSTTTFNSSSDVYTLPNTSSQGFIWAYATSGAYLSAPGMQIQQNTSSTNPQILVLASSTSNSISGTVTLGSGSCPSAYQNQYVAMMAMPNTSSPDMNSVQPEFFETNGLCSAAYSIALPGPGTYSVQAHLPPQSAVSGLLDPSGQTVTVSTSISGVNFTFNPASYSIYGRITDANGNAFTDPSKYQSLMVFAYQPIEGGQGGVGQPDSSGYFRIYATPGAYKLSISGNGMPTQTETDLLVTTSTAFAANASTPVIIFKLAPPTSYIDGYVKDASGSAISNINIYAYCDNGPGNGHAVTDGQGYYKMLLDPCSNYHVGGFSSQYGQMQEQSGIGLANQSSSQTVNFTINASNFVSISGAITQNGSTPISGANIWITQGETGSNITGGQTDTSGHFSLMIPSGSDNLYVHAAMTGIGQLGEEQVNSGQAVSANTTVPTMDSKIATLTIHLSPGNTFSQVFLMAQSSIGSGYSNLVSTSSSYDTYQVQVPYTGSSASIIINGGTSGGPIPATTTVITGNAIIPIDLSSDFYAVSGVVSGDYSNAYVWAGGLNGGGGAQVNSDGTFSLQLPQGTYDIGVNKDGYMGSLLSSQNISAATSGLSLTLTQATSTITGIAQYNGSPISNVRVWADNSSGGWAGSKPTDANGSFTINVTAGNWVVHAIADSYQLAAPLLVTAPASNVTIDLQAVSFKPLTNIQSVNPISGQTIGYNNTTLQFQQGTITDGSTNMSVSIADTMNVPDKIGSKVIGTAKNISIPPSANSSQTPTFIKDVTLNFTLTKAELQSDGISSISEINNLKIGYDDNVSNAWVNIPTTIILSPSGTSTTWNTLTSVTLSGPTKHFSTYVTESQTTGSAPSTPTGLQASGGNSQITLTWNSASGASSYYIYKYNGSDYIYLDQTSNTSYVDSVNNGATYSYKISAAGSNGIQSARTDAVSATAAASAVNGTVAVGASSITSSSGSGGSTAITTTATSTSASSTATNTATAATSTEQNTTPASAETAAVSGGENSINKITMRLIEGSDNAQVSDLQEFLAKYPDIYPEGIVSGYFGPLTKKAVEKFQEKYGIAKAGEPGYGQVGPLTSAQINNLLTVVTNSAASSSTTKIISSGNSQLVQSLKAQITTIQQKILDLLKEEIQLLTSGQ